MENPIKIEIICYFPTILNATVVVRPNAIVNQPESGAYLLFTFLLVIQRGHLNSRITPTSEYYSIVCKTVVYKSIIYSDGRA